ncbi:hypothetical protein WKH56_19495 [Priestia sp. SB1]|uniref:hypothetical protein n=1 Tax=Priestia sp. SB1 TaxID=3132359 RepID=UPI0031762189
MESRKSNLFKCFEGAVLRITETVKTDNPEFAYDYLNAALLLTKELELGDKLDDYQIELLDKKLDILDNVKEEVYDKVLKLPIRDTTSKEVILLTGLIPLIKKLQDKMSLIKE